MVRPDKRVEISLCEQSAVGAHFEFASVAQEAPRPWMPEMSSSE
jgi:hypothetical protein